jgi:hypothetical protein
MSLTIEDIQLAMVQNQEAAIKLITACQVRSAQHFEAKSEAEKIRAESDRDRALQEREAVRTNFMRPSLIHRPALTNFEDEWMVTYGDLTACGPTPEMAHQEFDRLWVGKDEL